MISTMRPQAGQNSAAYGAQSHRYNPFVAGGSTTAPTWGTLQYQIGSTLYPNAPIRTSEEVFQEVQRFWHSIGSTDVRGSITNTNWAVIAEPTALVVGTSTAANVGTWFTSTGTGCWAINLDNFINKSDVMNSGINTLTANVMMNLAYGTPPPVATRLDTYVHIDCVLAIEGGVLSIKV